MPEQALPPQATALGTSRCFANLTTEYPSQQLFLSKVELLADPGEIKVFLTDSPAMTTLLNLIDFCLRSLFAPLNGIYEAFQPVALSLCAQAAIKRIALRVFYASANLTPAHPIHAPTLFAPL